MALVVGFGLVLLAPGIAWGHAALVSSEPAPAAELGSAPGVVVLRFAEPLNVKLSRATVASPDGREFGGTATEDQEIKIPLSTNAQGVYEVDWTTVSTLDGHTLRGSFAFGVGVSPGVDAEGGSVSEPRALDLALAAARAIEDAALLLAVGMLVLIRLARREPWLAWVRPRVRLALVVALVAGSTVVLGEALAAAPSLSGGAVVTYITTGLPGTVRIARVGLELFALVASFFATGAVPIGTGLALVALAGAGHAAAVRPAWWGIPVEGVHLISAGAWAGGILSLAFVRPPGGWRSGDGRTLLERFSPVALVAFAFTVLSGLVRGYQEVGSIHELFASSYGLVLLAKSLTVVIMVQLSLLTWKRVIGSPRPEAVVAILAIGAAALLAAYPLPPGRVAEAEAPMASAAGAAAIPKQGDLTLGGHAGQVLVGLTLRPGEPGENEALVYLLPLEGEDAAVGLRAELTVGKRSISTDECGPTCRRAHVDLQGEERVRVRVEGPTGGTATFLLPSLPAPDGSEIVQRMMTRMHELSTYRQDETLSSGLAVVHARYAFAAPNRFESKVTESGGGSETVEIGGTRYLKLVPDGHWQVETGGPPPRVPAFVWDFFRPFVDPHIVGRAKVGGTPTQIVSFFGESGGTPVWFRLWIDAQGLVPRAEMRAQGHFMDHRYYAFDSPISIQPPT